jgi:signal transduction histidine kinase
LNRITFLRSLSRRFPRNHDPLSRFSIVERWLQKNLGLKKATLLLLHGKEFTVLAFPRKAVLTEGAPEFRRLRSGRPWMASRNSGNGPWLAVWPVLIDGDCIACWALGPKKRKAPWTKKDTQVMEWLADRTGLCLEQRRLWDQLEDANRQATLGWLLGAVLHEIRNPLSALNTFVQLMPQKGEDKDFQQSFHRVASKEIERLTGLTENLLNFLKAEPGKSEKLDLRPLVDHVAALARPLFKSKEVELKIRISKPLFVTGNEGQLECLILNLLQNAFNALGTGGWVEISGDFRNNGAKSGPFVVLRVRDNGKGISKEELSLIFKPFYSSTEGGTGLGLAICQKVVGNHGGHLEVKSTPGKGSAFSVYLPS